jgi:multidrug efflux pump subunit AcrA (membrane-fusion protein)
MDRTRTSAVRTPKKWILPALLVVGLTGVVGYYFSAPPTVAVEEERLTITTVGNDQFYEYLNLNGTVEPTDIYFLDSKVAGNIEQIYVSTGQRLTLVIPCYGSPTPTSSWR